MPQTYVITGATSFIGCRLVSHLLAEGHQVYAVCRDGQAALRKLGTHEHLVLVEVQLQEYACLAEKIHCGDVFVHLAWEGTNHSGRDAADVQQCNLRYSRQALDQAIRMGCQLFVEAGSQAEYGTQLQTITEETPCQPFSEYGKAKLSVCQHGFEVAETKAIKYMHLRIFSLYGEGDHPWTLVMTCVDKMLKGEPVALSTCTQNWNFLYIDDAVRQISRLCQYALLSNTFVHEIFNIASKDTRPLKEFVRSIWRLCDSKSELRFGEVAPKNIVSLQPDVSKTERVVGTIDTVSFEQVVKTIINTRRENNL